MFETKRDFLKAIAEGSVVSADMETYAKELMSKMDKVNEKKKTSSSLKKSESDAPLVAKATEILKGQKSPILCSQIAKIMGVSTSKMTPILNKVEGIVVFDVKVKGKGTRKAYVLQSVLDSASDEGSGEGSNE